MSRKVPRKRKINAVTDEELMPPPQMPVSKKHKTSKQAASILNVSRISDISNISNVCQTQNKCGQLSIIFEKAQENETLHSKYFKELTNIYEKVSIKQTHRASDWTLRIEFSKLNVPFIFLFFVCSWIMPFSWDIFWKASASGWKWMNQIPMPMLVWVFWPSICHRYDVMIPIL